MSLRLKVLLPLVLLGALLLAYLLLIWMPAHHEVHEQEFLSALDRHLDSVAESLAPLLSGHQVDTIYENLEVLKGKNPEWLRIELVDSKGHTVYPLHEEAEPPASPAVLRISKPINYMSTGLGTLLVHVDFSDRLEAMRLIDKRLMLTFAAIVLFFVLITGAILEKFVRRPVLALSRAAQAMAGGDFEAAVPEVVDDEVGSLVESFSSMRGSIKKYQSEILSQNEALKKLSCAIEKSPVAIAISNAECCVEYANPAYERLSGLRVQEALGQRFDEPLKPHLRTEQIEALWEAMSFGRPWRADFALPLEGGPLYEVVSVFPLQNEKGCIRNYLELRLDVTETRLAEDLVAEQNKLISNTLESLTHPFFLIDPRTYRVKLANSACGFGTLTEDSKCYRLTHKSNAPCSGEEHPCTIREVLRLRKPVTLEHIHYTEDGAPTYFEVYGYPVFGEGGEVATVIEYNIDITARKRLEQQFLQAQKMEAVGRLAGGVAHDFNNLLTAIIGYSELLATTLSKDSPCLETINIIAEAGRKAAALTNQLLAFSRKQMLQMRTTSLDDIMANIIKILKRVIGEDVELVYRPGSRLKIKADAPQIEQVLMNLAVNARDAMPRGGQIMIETSDVVLGADYAESHAEVRAGRYSLLSFTDNGEGMSREVREKIFEPFYTTKGTLGTGLGLATVYGIIRQHGGHIYVYSEPHKGTTFKIYFPDTSEDQTALAAPEKPRDLRGTETILVVDDEPSIRRLVADTLRPSGYRVLEAGSAEEALELCARFKNVIHLLLSDVVMPGLSGQELYYALHKTRPETRVILMSGYTDEKVSSHGLLEPGVSFLQKPVTPSILLPKIRELLDRDRGV